MPGGDDEWLWPWCDHLGGKRNQWESVDSGKQLMVQQQRDDGRRVNTEYSVWSIDSSIKHV